MKAKRTHFVPYIDQGEGTSWASCGRLVPNGQAYIGDAGTDEVTCKRCVRSIKKSDRQRGQAGGERPGYPGVKNGISNRAFYADYQSSGIPLRDTGAG